MTPRPTTRVTSRPATPVNRRRLLRTTGLVLAAGSATLVSGCSGLEKVARDLPRPEPRHRADNEDQPLLESVVADQKRVLAVCFAVRQEHRKLASVLDPIIEHHREHLRALGSEKSTPDPPGTRVPRRKGPAVGLLVDTEHGASRDRAADTQKAASGEFARLLAGISASSAQHVVELRRTEAGR